MAMSLSPLQRVNELGQSIWYDNIRRGLITSGELQRLIAQDAVTGVTSNPTIFERAIDGSTDYDQAIHALVAAGQTDPAQIVEQLAVEDIQAAADTLRPTYDRTRHQDGYVSLQVNPAAANDTRMTIAEARRLWERVNRPNVMLKVPATTAALPAIEQLVYEGVNVNATLIFSLDRHQEVAEAYLRGLEYRLQEKLSPSVASVASFFVSRVDTLVDDLLRQRMQTTTDPQQRATLQQLLGTAAIANATLAYQLYRQIFYGSRFTQLRAAGAATQRCLWASTSTTNPSYSDVKYVEALIGPETVATLAPQTIVAFQDHGHARASLPETQPTAEETMRRLVGAGIDMRAVMQQLEQEGVQTFADAYDQLIESTRQKVEQLRAAPAATRSSGGPAVSPAVNPAVNPAGRQANPPVNPAAGAAAASAVSLVAQQRTTLGSLQPLVTDALERAERERFADRLWRKDLSLWPASLAPQPAQQDGNPLGWLTLAEQMLTVVPQLEALRDEVRAGGLAECVLLGAGGSGLVPAILRESFGTAPGQPHLVIVDTADPAAITSLQQAIVPSQTLFLAAPPPGGGSVETLALVRFFYDEARQVVGERAGAQFLAIADPGSALEQLAQEYRFRAVFHNPPGLRGGYDAFSYTGLVPAALLGIDVRAILQRTAAMARACGPTVPASQNPAVRLGALLGALAANGQNKVTFAISPPLSELGAWLEQLLSNGTGATGAAMLPVTGETLGPPSVYSPDRVFVYIRTERAFDPAQDTAMDALEMAGFPVVRLAIGDAYDLGQELLLWQMANAIAAAYLGANPFAQPGVREAAANADRLLQDYAHTHQVPLPRAILQTETRNVAIVAEGEQALRIRGAISLQQALESILRQAMPGDWVGLLAYVQRTDETVALLQRLRLHVRDTRRVATTLAFESLCPYTTGQPRAGTPGLFVQFVATDPMDVPIPGATYTFGVLTQAQALGELQALEAQGRRVIRIDLGANVVAGLSELQQALDAAQVQAQPY